MPDTPEDSSVQKPDSSPKTISRRSFLKLGGAAAAVALVGPGSDSEPETSVNTLEELVAEVEGFSLEELEREMYERYPVVPNIEPIRDRLDAITDIPEGGNLMKAGSSVGAGMLDNVFRVDSSEIDLGPEQYKLDLVLDHFRIPEGASDAAIVGGVTADNLLYEPMFCQGPMPCPANTSVTDAYIDYYKPKVSINFVGTSEVRNRLPLNEFARSISEYIDYYESKGVIPVLTTFPQPRNSTDEEYRVWFNEPVPITHGGRITEEESIDDAKEFRAAMLPENALRYNVLLLKIAERSQIPIINLQRGAVEQVEHNGTRMPGDHYNWVEIDPEHFSSDGDNGNPLQLPARGEKFRYANHLVGYTVVQTLSDMVNK